MVNIYTYFEIFLDDLAKPVILKEFEKYFKLPHQTIKRHLEVLVKKNIVKLEKKDKFLFYRLNLENQLIYDYISICEKEKLFSFLSKNTLFNRLYQHLESCFRKNNILIFGSSVIRKDYNDIDILVLSEDMSIRKILENFESTYSKKMHSIQTSEKNLTDTLKKEIIKKHIIINNHDYFVTLLYKNER